ncbi:MAG TPA: hypothetical protein VFB21_10720 [Chthonomonadaceae bacterium]|nr:hypothetical protein [Chthonomonadaceae bacterium]
MFVKIVGNLLLFVCLLTVSCLECRADFFDFSVQITFEEGAPPADDLYHLNGAQTVLCACTSEAIYSATNISGVAKTCEFSYGTLAAIIQGVNTLSSNSSHHNSGVMVLPAGMKWGDVHDEVSTSRQLGLGSYAAQGNAFVEEIKTGEGDNAPTLLEPFSVVP